MKLPQYNSGSNPSLTFLASRDVDLVPQGLLEGSLEPGEFDIVGMRGRLMSAMEPGDLDIVERRGDYFTSRARI